jgi:hypothetical protein
LKTPCCPENLLPVEFKKMLAALVAGGKASRLSPVLHRFFLELRSSGRGLFSGPEVSKMANEGSVIPQWATPVTFEWPATELLENFAFLMNVSRLTGSDPASYVPIPGHQVRKANSAEIGIIRALNDSLAQGPFGPLGHLFARHLWEDQFPHPGGQHVPLQEAEWRYHVIAFEGWNGPISELQIAAALAPVELEFGLTIMRQGYGWHPERVFRTLADAPHNPAFFLDVTPNDIAVLRTVNEQLGRVDAASPIYVKNYAQQLLQLKALPAGSPLRFLGYFAILESLLTHKPKPTDPYESITRQVTQKLALLDNRWESRLDYTSFQNGARHETIWKKMYSYRSAVAHGDVPDFGSGDLALLVSPERAMALIKQSVKAVLRFALVEPRLVADLRDC